MNNKPKGQIFFRDRVFRMIFNDKEALLSLYNALNETCYKNAEELTITTADNVVYMHMKNDTSFLFDNVLCLYEQQSTWNPNMPLRMLFYIVEQYRRLIDDSQLYGTKQIELPTPVCVVFYNGKPDSEDMFYQSLSDSFTEKKVDSSIEVTVIGYNIRYGHNPKLLNACQKLKEYSIFVNYVETYIKESRQLYPHIDAYPTHLKYALDKAIQQCIEKDVLRHFLQTRRNEVRESMLSEYNEEKVKELWRQESFEDGFEDGFADGFADGLTCQSISIILKKFSTLSAQEFADFLDKDIAFVERVIELSKEYTNWDARQLTTYISKHPQ